jgi:uncharacterized membrane protein
LSGAGRITTLESMPTIAIEPRMSTSERALSPRELQCALRAAEAENRALARRLAELKPSIAGLRHELEVSRRELTTLRAHVARLQTAGATS